MYLSSRFVEICEQAIRYANVRLTIQEAARDAHPRTTIQNVSSSVIRIGDTIVGIMSFVLLLA
jgi:hypothetical protein